jgi:hypothetical protein
VGTPFGFGELHVNMDNIRAATWRGVCGQKTGVSGQYTPTKKLLSIFQLIWMAYNDFVVFFLTAAAVVWPIPEEPKRCDFFPEHTDQYGQSGVDISESMTIEEGKKAGSASNRDRFEGTGPGVSFYTDQYANLASTYWNQG